MNRPLALTFAFTMLALPVACGDDDEDGNGGTGGAATGGSMAKGGSSTGGKASGGTAGKATGGTTGGTPTMAGAGGDTGEAGGGPAPEGGTAGAGEEPSEGGSGGAAGGGTVPSEGGTAGATDPPSEGGTAGAGTEPSEGGAAGAAEPTAEELMATICAKTPGGDECDDEGCIEGLNGGYWDEPTVGCATAADEWRDEAMTVLECIAAADDDDLICLPPIFPDPAATCVEEHCRFWFACYGEAEIDAPECDPFRE